MIGQVIKLHVLFYWKRLAIFFLLSGFITYNFEPLYIQGAHNLSLCDWLLEASSSPLTIYFFATLAVVLLTFDVTHWLWTPFGMSSLARLHKRATVFWAYIIVVALIVTYAVGSLLLWSIIVGYVRYDGYEMTLNVHPFFKLTDSPLWFVATHWLIDWWSLFFIACLGLLGAFFTKNVLWSFLLSFGWVTILMVTFKSGLSFKGLLPGEGILLSVHEYGLPTFWMVTANESIVVLVLVGIYFLIASTHFIVSRANR